MNDDHIDEHPCSPTGISIGSAAVSSQGVKRRRGPGVRGSAVWVSEAVASSRPSECR